MNWEIEEIFIIGLVFIMLGFLVPFGLQELSANSSNAGDLEPIILAFPYIMLAFGILIILAKVMSK